MTDASTTAATSAGRPRTRQRIHKQAAPLDVPHIEEDAAERKRVLNVLAQRRYREKKRLNRLKAGSVEKNGAKEAETPTYQIQEPSPSSSTEIQEEDTVDAVLTSANATAPFLAPSPGIIAGLDFGLSSWEPISDMSFSPLLPQLMTPGDSDSENLLQQQGFVVEPGLPGALTCTVDTSVLNSPSTAASTASSDFNFPDSFHLPVLELTLLKAVMRISERMGCGPNIWDLDSVSPFSSGMGTPSDQLPAAWRPTAIQVLVPHHPIFDFLPWPSVRDRIINILTLPDEMRPSNAKGPLALVNFAYDIEDSAEGVRIYGGDPYEPGSWEVGQVLFERWWFLFDRHIIDNSNRWRRMRGAPPLLLKGVNSCSSPGASGAAGVS
ncbi:hypothetical protein B0J13DRAFT_126409 [Dactylonectria estremocensis]|uniref:BZIP domain-containing protein n=1 Tax=Dactylonectria estremocensis TaxID=1079267 RepID=A0A9P9FEH5_9HYPO|nr:hypothetical protein B0J13DRAFT_126409 [Dactylonectria estremocensis]